MIHKGFKLFTESGAVDKDNIVYLKEETIVELIKQYPFKDVKSQLELLWLFNANCSKKRPKDYDDLKNQIEMWFRNEWNEVKVLETSKKNGGNTHSLETIKMFYEVMG